MLRVSIDTGLQPQSTNSSAIADTARVSDSGRSANSYRNCKYHLYKFYLIDRVVNMCNSVPMQ